MKILVLNCGSSSLKYQLIDMEKETVLAKGNCERIGEEESFCTHKVKGEKYVIKEYVKDHEEALKLIIDQLLHKDYGVIGSLKEINAIGHRIVQGAEIFKESALIDDKVIEQIKECSELAPLHNPAAVLGILACKDLMPEVKMVATFDTAFHQTMPKDNYIYPIPYQYYEKYKVRKYGAHGTSHQYVSKVASEMMRKPIEELKIVTCHLGQGASICAVQYGKSIDTSMGLTPLGGIPMVTRSGDLDPSIVTYIMEKENLTPNQMNSILNKQSGLVGISGLVPDFREIEVASREREEEKSMIAIHLFNTQVAQYIAKYAVSMEGIDAIVFTGGIGENQIPIRKGICEKLSFMGVKIDEEKNEVGGQIEISTPDSLVKTFIIPTNEELVIARDTKKIVTA